MSVHMSILFAAVYLRAWRTCSNILICLLSQFAVLCTWLQRWWGETGGRTESHISVASVEQTDNVITYSYNISESQMRLFHCCLLCSMFICIRSERSCPRSCQMMGWFPCNQMRCAGPMFDNWMCSFVNPAVLYACVACLLDNKW